MSCGVTVGSLPGVAAKLAMSVNTPIPMIVKNITTGTIELDFLLLISLILAQIYNI